MIRLPPVARWSAHIVVAAGIALHIAAWVAALWSPAPAAESRQALFPTALLVSSSLPYLLCLGVTLRFPRNPLVGLCGGLAALAMDLHTHYSVFIAPTSSTAAISLLFTPIVNLLVIVPLGMLAGRAIERLWHTAAGGT